ncbi:MAG: hypothetical protein IK066_12430 [Kiritimatiellae bacterium]|nr:hypothetical protein [Kiritimatiellia bacterium]
MKNTKFRPRAALAGAALLSALVWAPAPALAEVVFSTFTASRGTHEDKVHLAWSETSGSSGNGTYYVVRSSWTDGQLGMAHIGETPDTQFDDTTAEPGIPYRYAIGTKDVDGTTIYTDSQTEFRDGVVGWAGTLAEAVNVAASQGLYADKIRITWNVPSDASCGGIYTVFRRAEGGATSGYKRAAMNIRDTFYDDTDIVKDVVYEYHVTTFDDSVARSEDVRGWAADPPPIHTVTDLSATQGTLEDRVRLAWTAPENAASYELLRYHYVDSEAIREEIAEGLTDTGYDDLTADAGVRYNYAILVTDIYGRTSQSPYTADGWWLPETPVVTDFSASRGEYKDMVLLAWDVEVPEWIASYGVRRIYDQGEIQGFENLADSLTIPRYYDMAVTPDVRYRYQVWATDIWGRKSFSDVAEGWASPLPDNDDFEDARAISSKSGNDVAANDYATVQAGEPIPARWVAREEDWGDLLESEWKTDGHTLWWRYTAPCDGIVRFDTAGSVMEDGEMPILILSAFTGSTLGTLEEHPSNADASWGVNGCTNSLEVAAGTVYSLQVASCEWEETGEIHLNWAYTHLRLELDPNGGTISTNVVMVPVGQTLGDAMQSFPVPEREGYRLVDWKFENNASATASANFAVTESHVLAAEWEWISSNDDFEDAAPLDLFGQRSGSSAMPNTNATVQAGEPLLAAYPDATHTIWWWWRAPADGRASVSTTNSVDKYGYQIDTVLGVYTGSSLDSLVQVAKGDDGVDDSGFIDDVGTFWSFAEFEAKKETLYYICVGVNDKYNRQAVEGTICLNWSLEKSGGLSSGGFALLPPGASGPDIPLALGGVADPSVEDLIGDDVDVYNDFAEWANGKGAEDVRASAHAGASYQLGTTVLLQNEPEVTIDGVAVVSANPNGTPDDGAKAVRPREAGEPVTLTLNVTVSDGGEPVEVTAEKVAALVQATSDVCDWDSPETRLDPHAVALTTGSTTLVTIVATPGDGFVPQAFLRIAP